MNIVRDFYKVPKPSSMPSTHGLDEILPFLLPKPGGALLDIGCFDGIKTTLIGSAVGCTDLFGVDFLVERLAEAAARGIHTSEVDLNSGRPLQFPAAQFDVIICSEVIEHVYSPDDLLDEVARLLKPDGYAILTTPNLASWKNRVALVLGWQPLLTEVSTREHYGNPFFPKGRPSGHIRVFTLRALVEMLEAQGLHPARVGGAALRSPGKSFTAGLSRAGDAVLSRFPALADRLILRVDKP